MPDTPPTPEQNPPDAAPETRPQERKEGSASPENLSENPTAAGSAGSSVVSAILSADLTGGSQASATGESVGGASLGGSLGGSLSGSGGSSVTASPKPAASKPERGDSLSELLVSRQYVTADQVRAAVAKGKATKINPIKILLDEGTLKQEDYDTLRAEIQHRQSQNIRIPGYEVVGFLGAGAMASVFKGRQMSLDRTVAIKVLPQKYSEDPEFVRRFAEDGKIAAKLNHPNIVQAYDEGIAGHQHFFVMEYIDGTTVHDVIMKKGAYGEKATLDIAVPIADALAHAHQMGLIHRDVKPKNIMLTSKGVPKLADMGLAVQTSRPGTDDEKGKIYGTPAYLAPEQAKPGVVLDLRADIYSFGATLFHMVTGRVPFPAGTAVEMIQKHLGEPLEPPHTINKGISSGLSDIIEVCMAKEPGARYHDAEDLVADLRAVQRGEPPLIARRAFTIDALADIEPKDKPGTENPSAATAKPSLPPGMEIEPVEIPWHKQRIYWVAIAGWALAAIMTIIAVLRTK